MATIGECPVCGDVFDVTPRRCPRCDTPHHPECWDYVPGCAVFGCAEASPPAIVEWPWAHALLVTRARLTSLAANLLQLSLVVFMTAVAFGKSRPDSLITLTALCLLGLVVTAPLALAAQVAYLFSPAYQTLARATEEGDRRLRSAIDRQSGAIIPLPAYKVALLLGGLVVMPHFVSDLWELAAAGALLSAKMVGVVVAALILPPVVGAMLYPLLWISERMIGSQRILARRLEASLALPEKPKSG